MAGTQTLDVSVWKPAR